MKLEENDVQAIAEAVVARLRGLLPAETAGLRLQELGIPVRTARRAIKTGELVASLVGREYRVTPAARDAWLEARRVRPREPRPDAKHESAAQRAILRARSAGALRAIPGGS